MVVFICDVFHFLATHMHIPVLHQVHWSIETHVHSWPRDDLSSFRYGRAAGYVHKVHLFLTAWITLSRSYHGHLPEQNELKRFIYIFMPFVTNIKGFFSTSKSLCFPGNPDIPGTMGLFSNGNVYCSSKEDQPSCHSKLISGTPEAAFWFPSPPPAINLLLLLLLLLLLRLLVWAWTMSNWEVWAVLRGWLSTTGWFL